MRPYALDSAESVGKTGGRRGFLGRGWGGGMEDGVGAGAVVVTGDGD